MASACTGDVLISRWLASVLISFIGLGWGWVRLTVGARSARRFSCSELGGSALPGGREGLEQNNVQVRSFLRRQGHARHSQGLGDGDLFE